MRVVNGLIWSMESRLMRLVVIMGLVWATAFGCGCDSGGHASSDGKDASIREDALQDAGTHQDTGTSNDAGADASPDTGPNPNIIVFPEEGDYDVIGFTNQGGIITYSILDNDDIENPLDVYYYDIGARMETRIEKPGTQGGSAVFSRTIVYQEDTIEDLELYLYDIDTQTDTRLTNTPWLESNAEINQDFIVFHSSEGCSGPYSPYITKLVLMNRHTQEQIVLAECDQNAESESISPYHVGWVARPYPGHNKDVYYHDLSTGITHHIESTGVGDQFLVTTDEDHVVWQDHRDGHREVYMYTISTGVEECLTPDEWEQAWPFLREGIVLWADYSTTQEWGEGGASQVYAYDVETRVGRQITNKAQMWMPRYVDSGWAVYAWRIIGHHVKIHAHDLVGDGIMSLDGHIIP